MSRELLREARDLARDSREPDTPQSPPRRSCWRPPPPTPKCRKLRSISVAATCRAISSLTPSVEWPTINSVANLGAYDETREYLGYFDARKCYVYVYSATEVAAALQSHARHDESPLRRSERVERQLLELGRDADDRSVPERADRRRPRPRYGYGDVAREGASRRHRAAPASIRIAACRRRATNTTLVQGATPAGWDSFHMRIQGLGNKMRFMRAYGRRQHQRRRTYALRPGGSARSGLDIVYEVSVRVAVCVAGLRESNCREYASGVEARRTDPTVLRGFAHRRVRLFERSATCCATAPCCGPVRSSSVR